ncbi:uncharacterized protein H6S33_005458 [Morchella sextelata]|uniref:uncharacterized protein n=1 Tax=Morchella sextelata TaxID=1174677 RepID=UPI001D0449A1|nr:uncharacterized protein H6S33_005458 [Morchella sextelata]KAH0613572.1 hypothetical protein H6S33_005458 [Morchella sextelata]
MRHNLKSQNPIQLLSTLPNPYQAPPAAAPSPYYAPSVPSAGEFTPSSSSNVTTTLPPSSLPSPPAHPVESVVLLMLLLTRRWFGAYFSLGSVGWLWHQNIVNRESPDSWSAGEYAGADKALNGWDAAICKGVGLCRNKFGSNLHVEKEEMRKGEMESTPDFVLDYAPYVYLYSQERFLPGDIGEHLRHTIPYLNYSPITSYNNHQSLKNLAELNQFGTNVYLTSDDDPEHPPEWLRGDRNKPISPGSDDDDDLLGMSAAPGIIIWVEKGEGIVDAFYFYFYSFNLGNKVAGWRFGNHVGDWEHNAVRFVNGQPESMFYSEHSGGAAYEYQAVEKIGLRPVSYSARGSHANYARPGVHYYAIPFHLLADVTDKGTLWDVTKNSYIYKWNMTSDILTPSRETPLAPVEWFHFEGRWGDRFYPLSDRRQYRVAGQYHYVNGPTGPKFKNLDRKEVCQNEGICVVQPSLTLKLEGVNGGKWDEEDIPWPGDSKEETDVEGADGYDFGGDYAGEAGAEID